MSVLVPVVAVWCSSIRLFAGVRFISRTSTETARAVIEGQFFIGAYVEKSQNNGRCPVVTMTTRLLKCIKEGEVL